MLVGFSSLELRLHVTLVHAEDQSLPMYGATAATNHLVAARYDEATKFSAILYQSRAAPVLFRIPKSRLMRGPLLARLSVLRQSQNASPHILCTL